MCFSAGASFDFAGAVGSQSTVLFRYNTTEYYPPYQRKILKNFLDTNNFTIDNIRYRRPAYSAEGGFFKIALEQICPVTNIC